MDGFTGYKTVVGYETFTAQAITVPFHVVRLAGDALNWCRGRVQ